VIITTFSAKRTHIHFTTVINSTTRACSAKCRFLSDFAPPRQPTSARGYLLVTFWPQKTNLTYSDRQFGRPLDGGPTVTLDSLTGWQWTHTDRAQPETDHSGA
jgi:hypothetical protein